MAQSRWSDNDTAVLSWLAGATTLVALILFGLGEALRLPAHFGVEDWLGWTSSDALDGAKDAWQAAHGVGKNPAAVAYLLIDTAVFMPLYGLTLLWATWLVWGILEGTGERLTDKVLGWVCLLCVPLLLALWICDAVENLGGLARLGVSVTWGWAAVGLALLGLVLIARWMASTDWHDGGWAIVWGAAAVLGIGWLAFDLSLDVRDASWVLPWPHRCKQYALSAALAPMTILWLSWWFGLDVDPRAEDTLKRANGFSPGEVRAACRQVAMGVIGRSRYVLVMLAVFGVFTLGLDQCRDVLLALATTKANMWWWVIMLTTATALGLLSHTCWLWARVVGRVKRSGYEVPKLQGVPDWAGEWARSWARLLMLAPLLMVASLIANVAGDAAIAAKDSKAPDNLWETLQQLLCFASSVVAMAVVLIKFRQRRSLGERRAYYNDVPSVRDLLEDPYFIVGRPPGPPGKANALRRIATYLSRPIGLPLLALTVLLAVRGCMVTSPDITALAPPTLAVVALSLVWWLGPLGLISASEQHAVFPWGLLLLVLAGFVGNFSDNHQLPALVVDNPDAVAGALAAIGWVAFCGLLLLSVGSALMWLALALPTRTLVPRVYFYKALSQAQAESLGDRLRVLLTLLLVAAICLGLRVLDSSWRCSSGSHGRLPTPATKRMRRVRARPRPIWRRR